MKCKCGGSLELQENASGYFSEIVRCSSCRNGEYIEDLIDALQAENERLKDHIKTIDGKPKESEDL